MQRSASRVFRVLLLGIGLFSLADSSHAARILVLPTPLDSSHTFTMRIIHDELVLRHHDVQMMIVEADIPKLSAVTQTGTASYLTHLCPELDLAGLVSHETAVSFKKLTVSVQKVWGSACDALLSDKEAIAKVQEFKPDLVVGISYYICTAMLSAKLGIPYVTVTPGGIMPDEMQPRYVSSWNPNIPPRYSYSLDIEGRFSHPKSFLDRARHILSALDAQLHDYRHTRPYLMGLQKKHGLDMASKPTRRLEMMHLFSGDFALEQPRPLPPKVKLVGALLASPAKPLPQDLEAFVLGAGQDGVILISLGTNAQFGQKEITALAKALAQLPQRVIWKLSAKEVAKAGGLASMNLTANIKVMPWVPQNDILGHPSTRAFLSHMGANGLSEAAYHGVPVVAMPIFADQQMNAMKAVSKGFAVVLRREGLTEKAAIEAFSRVLREGSYAEAARKVSRRMQTRKRSPVQEAGDWIEHALELEGDSYLSMPEEELSWIVLNNMDVYASFGMAAAACVVILYILVREMRRRVALFWPEAPVTAKKVL